MILTAYNIQIIDTHENDRVLVEERTQAGAPQLVYNGADDKYGTLMTSELKFNFSVPGAVDGKFFHLYSGNDTRYKVRLFDQDETLLWEGFLLPDQYSEPYQRAHLFVDMVATDGIGRIKGKRLDYQYYNKETSVIKLIAECLKLTGLSQDILFAPAILPAAVDYRWDEIAVDGTVYREEEDGVPLIGIGAKLPKRKNAYEILDLLLKSIGCMAYTWAGQWYVVGINRRHEAESAVVRYNANGVFVENTTMVRDVVEVHFEATPTVSIVSPWKTVTMTWAIDEDGNLLPENAISEDPDKFSFVSGNPFVDASIHGLPTEDPLRYWEKVGGIRAGVGSREGKYAVDNTVVGSIPVPKAIGPYNLSVGKITGETTAGTNANRIQLKKPKFLKVSDEYIRRYLKVRVEVFGNGGSQQMIEDEVLQDLFRCEITTGNLVMLSNRPGGPGYINFKYEVDYRAGSTEVLEENPLDQNVYNLTLEQVTGKLEKEFITLLQNGFLNIRFFAPVSPNPSSPVFKDYVFVQLELEYTAQDEWYDDLTRAIDFTTVYDLDYFHGDSMQDLSKKQFRFRRWIPFPEGESNVIDVLFTTVTVNPFLFNTFAFAVSYQHAQLVLQNPALLTVVWDEQDYTVDSLYSPSDVITWGVAQGSDGVWYITLIVGTHPIFGAIENFESFFINDGSEGQYGFVEENNEWRESWKRYGIDEDRRHGLCMGRMYHDVQPEPLVNLEGTLFEIHHPNELFAFHWMEDRVFIPLRLTMDLSKGKTTGVTMMEAKIENIDDYAAG